MSFNVYVKRRGENNMCPGASMHGKKSNHRVQKSKNVMIKHYTHCPRGESHVLIEKNIALKHHVV